MTTYKIGMRYTVNRNELIIECEDYELVEAEDLISAVKFIENMPGYIKANGRAFSVEEIPDTEIDDDIIANTFYVNGRPQEA